MTELKYKVGDKVRIKSLDWYNENKNECGEIQFENNPHWRFVKNMSENCGKISIITAVNETAYRLENIPWNWTDEMIEGLVEEEKVKDMGEVSDGYHTFNELYEYRLLYNASMFNELAKQNLYDVHKSKRHSDGEVPFGDPNWFIVMAELPTGQISNHYEMKDWDLFDIPEKEIANEWDGHTPKDVAERLRRFLTPKSKYPQTYEECCKIIHSDPKFYVDTHLYSGTLETLYKLLICRDAYLKIAGEEMGLGKPWEPDWNNDEWPDMSYISYDGKSIDKENGFPCCNMILIFPTEEMRDAFYEVFKEDIEYCKELL